VSVEITGGVDLPARREGVDLHTADGLTLVGELALPLEREPVATLVCLHPLPTHGGFMDSHILRKAAGRLPALADVAVLRFNFRGVTSARGTSDGEFGHGIEERHDLAAAMDFVSGRDLPAPWLLGWSFGTEVVLKWGLQHPIVGAILLSPPLRRATPDDVATWAGSGKRLVAVIPEFDDYLRRLCARDRTRGGRRG
jgi:alpha/beta superfamily hydrolase